MKYINTKDTEVQALACEYKAPQVLYIKDVNKPVLSGNSFGTNTTIKIVKTGTNYDFYKPWGGLKFTCIQGGAISFSGIKSGQTHAVQYSKDDGRSWTDFINYEEVTVAIGDEICVKGDYTKIENNMGWSFSGVGENIFDISGDVMSMFYGENYVGTTIPVNQGFSNAFCGYCNMNIRNAKDLILPSSNLTEYCFSGMFDGTYTLITAPALPATSLANQCYASMFNGCTSLTTAPELPATTLVDGCYSNMFQGCTNLNYIKCLATTNTENNTFEWLDGVSATGIFVKNASMSTWTRDTSGIPEVWTVQDA